MNTYADAESEFKAENTSFREIVMRHIERISKLSAFELFHGGYYEQRQSGHTMVEKWIPDGKDVYCNTVQALFDLLYSYFDKDMLNREKQFSQNIKTALRRFGTPVDTNSEFFDFKDDGNLNLYKNARYILHTKLFRDLCAFLKRKRFLEAGSLEQ